MNRDILYEYDEYLLGNISSFSRHFFNSTDRETEENVLLIFKYAIEDILQWTPIEARDYLTEDVIKRLKLDKLIKKVKFPGELNPHTDYFYITHLLYPNVVKFNERELILKTYKEVLAGKLYKFPKEYLDGAKGVMRICVCFQYMIAQYLSFSSIKEIYEFFTTPAGSKALKKYRLYPVCIDKFEFQIDFLHQSLPNVQKDEFWYNYYRFQLKKAKLLKKEKQEKSATDVINSENEDEMD